MLFRSRWGSRAAHAAMPIPPVVGWCCSPTPTPQFWPLYTFDEFLFVPLLHTAKPCNDVTFLTGRHSGCHVSRIVLEDTRRVHRMLTLNTPSLQRIGYLRGNVNRSETVYRPFVVSGVPVLGVRCRRFALSFAVADLDPATAGTIAAVLKPTLSIGSLLMIVRIVMTWYPDVDATKFPWSIAYTPTEPVLSATRKIVKPFNGLDVSPIVWFAILSFLSEILTGPQGILSLLQRKGLGL